MSLVGIRGVAHECESTHMTAAREFVEESLGCVGVCARDETGIDCVGSVIDALERDSFGDALYYE